MNPWLTYSHYTPLLLHASSVHAPFTATSCFLIIQVQTIANLRHTVLRTASKCRGGEVTVLVVEFTAGRSRVSGRDVKKRQETVPREHRATASIGDVICQSTVVPLQRRNSLRHHYHHHHHHHRLVYSRQHTFCSTENTIKYPAGDGTKRLIT